MAEKAYCPTVRIAKISRAIGPGLEMAHFPQQTPSGVWCWTVIVPEGMFKPNQLAIWFPPGTGIPMDIANEWSPYIDGYIDRNNCNCHAWVEVAKLHGEKSHGFIVPAWGAARADVNIGPLLECCPESEKP